MSEETKVCEGGGQPLAKSLRDEVAETLAASSQRLRGMVRNQMVQEELDRRAELILKGIAKQQELARTYRAIKPDQQSFDAAGKLVAETYSKGKLDEASKAKAELAKIEKAVEMALADEKPDFSKLKELCK